MEARMNEALNLPDSMSRSRSLNFQMNGGSHEQCVAKQTELEFSIKELNIEKLQLKFKLEEFSFESNYLLKKAEEKISKLQNTEKVNRLEKVNLEQEIELVKKNLNEKLIDVKNESELLRIRLKVNENEIGELKKQNQDLVSSEKKTRIHLKKTRSELDTLKQSYANACAKINDYEAKFSMLQQSDVKEINLNLLNTAVSKDLKNQADFIEHLKTHMANLEIIGFEEKLDLLCEVAFNLKNSLSQESAKTQDMSYLHEQQLSCLANKVKVLEELVETLSVDLKKANKEKNESDNYLNMINDHMDTLTNKLDSYERKFNPENERLLKNFFKEFNECFTHLKNLTKQYFDLINLKNMDSHLMSTENLFSNLTNEQFVFDALDSEFLSTKIKEINRVKVCLATLVFELNTFKLADVVTKSQISRSQIV